MSPDAGNLELLLRRLEAFVQDETRPDPDRREAQVLLERGYAMVHGASAPTAAEIEAWLDAVNRWVEETGSR